jgi:GTP cyclohydrolase I
MPVKVGVISKMAKLFQLTSHRLRVQELGKCILCKAANLLMA